MSDTNVLMEKIALAIYETARTHFEQAAAKAPAAEPDLAAVFRVPSSPSILEMTGVDAARLLDWVRASVRSKPSDSAEPLWSDAPASPQADAESDPVQMSLLPDEAEEPVYQKGKHKRPRRSWVTHPEIGARMTTYSMNATQHRKRANEYKKLAASAKTNEVMRTAYLSMYEEAAEKARHFKRKYDTLLKNTARREEEREAGKAKGGRRGAR
jgi:hypothetical protein